MSANQESEADAAKPIILEQKKPIILEQKYRPAAHGSKPIPVYDARDWGVREQQEYQPPQTRSIVISPSDGRWDD